MKQPRISVVISVRNEAEKIEQCLKAVFSQTYKAYEVIVVDGHSADETVKIARKFPVRVFYENCHNRAGGCQIGVENAQGQYVAFTDADCIPDRNWLANLIKELDDGIVGVGGRYEDVGSGLWTHSINLTLRTFFSGAKSRSSKKKFMRSLSICGANGMCRRKDIQKVGGFNVNLSGSEDLELSSRLSQVGKLLYIPDALVLHNHNRGLKSFIKQTYRYGGWRRECRIWDLQIIPPIAVPLIFLSLIFIRQFFLGMLLLYSVIITAMGIKFTIQEKSFKYLISIPVVYSIEHFFYIIGFWKEIIRPREKETLWK